MINVTINTNLNTYNIECIKNTSLKEIINNLDINFIFPCGAKGNCGNCKVKIKKGIMPASRLDKVKLNEIELKEGYRLACNTYIENDMEIELKEISELNFIDL